MAGSHVRDVVGDLVERRVPVHLVARRREERVLLIRRRSGDLGRRHHPDAHALVAPGVQIPGVMQGHLGVGRVQRTHVYVVEPALAPHEHLPQRPTGPARAGPLRAHAATFRACLAAWAAAASRTQSPASWARRRCATRSALHGPFPDTTCLNSSQSTGPKWWCPRPASQRSSGAGSVPPSAPAWGTVMSTNRCRSSSLVCRLIFQAMDWAVLADSASGGPNIISDGHHQRFVASWTISRWASVPRIIVISSS